VESGGSLPVALESRTAVPIHRTNMSATVIGFTTHPLVDPKHSGP
jgi:hypothetical protein